MEPIRSSSRIDNNNKISTNGQSYEGNNLTRRNTLALSKKQSADYCNEFKNNAKMHNRMNLLLHLANSLSRNSSNSLFPYNQITIKIPEYIFDWEYVTNESTGISVWKKRAKIKLSQIEVDSILKLSIDEISKSKYYYKKRLWLYHYIHNSLLEKNKDNPLLVVSRENILEESFNQFMTTKDLNLKTSIQIHFIDEVAHDAGGVYREWYSCLFKEFFNEKNKLFILNPNECLFKGTYLIHLKTREVNMQMYNFFGKLISKAIIDKTNINENINTIIVKSIHKKPITLEDMKFYDIDIYSALKAIKDVKDNNELGEFSFVWNTRNEDDELEEVELIPNGRNIKLTIENREQFIERVIRYITYEQYKEQIENIIEGMTSLIPENIIQLFSYNEFAFLITGQQEIDIDDWQNNTIYRGKYVDGTGHEIIKMFWEVLRELDKSDLIAFFQFCTGSGRVPIDGFGALKGVGNRIQKFCIEDAENKGGKGLRLIEAKTCFNRIYIPEYKSKEEMKKAIYTIIGNDTNYFGLE